MTTTEREAMLADKARAWDAIIAARKDEREKCAQVVESFFGQDIAKLEIARAIRSRVSSPTESPEDQGPDTLGERSYDSLNDSGTGFDANLESDRDADKLIAESRKP